MIIFFFFFFGVIAGVFGGLGMGGGTLLIPLLTIFLGYEQKLCQGINLISFLVMALISLIIHYKNGYLAMKNIYYIILPGVIFSAGGALLAGYLPSNVLRIGFGVFLSVLSIFEFYKAVKK